MMNNRLRPIVVLFNPDEAAIGSLMELAEAELHPLAVVNAIDADSLARLQLTGIELLVNPSNLGLARAFNQGIERALAGGAEYVMLLDQDTRPPDGMASALLARADRFVASGGQLGCLGPCPIDRKQPKAQAFARATRPADPTTGLVPVQTIISSGMLIPSSAILQTGGMWNELFIDHIDHEWCFRAAARGLAVMIAPDIPMPHDMGDDGFAFRGRYKPIHRSPPRQYYLVRNTLWLARCSVIPRRWRIIEACKLAYRVPSYLLFSSARRQSLREIWRGLRHGLGQRKARTLSA